MTHILNMEFGRNSGSELFSRWKLNFEWENQWLISVVKLSSSGPTKSSYTSGPIGLSGPDSGIVVPVCELQWHHKRQAERKDTKQGILICNIVCDLLSVVGCYCYSKLFIWNFYLLWVPHVTCPCFATAICSWCTGFQDVFRSRQY